MYGWSKKLKQMEQCVATVDCFDVASAQKDKCFEYINVPFFTGKVVNSFR